MTTIPAPTNRGLIPAGTRLEDGAVVVRSSDTAYEVEYPGSPGVQRGWRSFDLVHGRPAPVMPLVVLSSSDQRPEPACEPETIEIVLRVVLAPNPLGDDQASAIEDVACDAHAQIEGLHDIHGIAYESATYEIRRNVR